MSLSFKIDKLLSLVQKPARYMGGELNSTIKDTAKIDVRYAFLFPDVYEVGMSHLGMKILYHAINSRTDAYCERVFSPWVDMVEEMRKNNIPLFSIETRTPISEFDILGITLQYEMCYTNILGALDLAGMPLKSCDRTSGPFVFAGGPCAFNPEPLHAFIDVFTLGDGEESIYACIECYKAWKLSGLPRAAFYEMASQIPGAYVPSLYYVEYNDDNTVKSITPKSGSKAAPRVMKAMVTNLDAAMYPDNMIVPYGEIVHDRIMLEIFRGCTRGCRFCQAGMIYRPVRERSLETLMELAKKLVDNTGYEEISLMSLSSGDYSCLPELAKEMVREFQKKQVSISLPSLRIDSKVKEALIETQKVRKSGLTFAPEAGTQRLRDVINKGVTEEDLLNSVRDAFESGWSSIKLYFMIGLPTETDEDIKGIADLTSKVVNQYFMLPKGTRPKGLRVNVSASCFVPKPNTPFQWATQDNWQTLIEKQKKLRSYMNGIKGVEFNYHESILSMLEVCFALGDRRMATVLENAYLLGCRFDGWHDHFNMDLWLKAFEQAGVNIDFYAYRHRQLSEVLPWSHIDAGVSQEFLKREWERAMNAEVTPDCRNGCHGCGVARYEGACNI